MEEIYQEFRIRIETLGVYTRDYTYYFLYTLGCLISVFGSLYLIALTDNIYIQSLNSFFLATALVQTGMLGHDLSHGQVFKSAKINRFFARIVWCLFGGLSESKWFLKHNAHHLYTNKVGMDPDLDIPFIFSVKQQSAQRSVIGGWILANQHILFFLALPLIYLGQIAYGVIHIFEHLSWSTVVEFLLMTVRIAVALALPLLLLPFPVAALFIFINFTVTGVYMSLVFAPNHKGKDILSEDERETWMNQITSTRNISAGKLTFFLFGGLHLQIEHHLFPSAARTQYTRIRPFVKKFCEDNSIPYAEISWAKSMREIYFSLRVLADSVETTRSRPKKAVGVDATV